METILNLVFKDEDNKSKTIRISNPKPNLTEEQVRPVMTKILDTKFLVNKNGAPMVALSAARLRNVTDLLEEDESSEDNKEHIPDPDPDEEGK